MRPHCEQVDACRAKGAGHCGPCSARSPEVRAKKSAGIRKALAADPVKMERRRSLNARLAADPAIREKRLASLAVSRSDPASQERHRAGCARGAAKRMADPVKRAALQKAGREIGALNIAAGRRPEVRAKAAATRRARSLEWCPLEYRELNATLKAKGIILADRKEVIFSEIDRVAQRRAVEVARAAADEAAFRNTFEGKLQRIREGAGIVQRPDLRTAGPAFTLGGIASAAL